MPGVMGCVGLWNEATLSWYYALRGKTFKVSRLIVTSYFHLQLTQLGSEQFVEAENDVFQTFTPTNSLISLSGSNPMHCQFKNHAQ